MRAIVAVTLCVLLFANSLGAQPAPDRDGDDDPADPGTGTRPARGHFERVGRARDALRRVCDLTVHRGALWIAMANSPLGSDGARIVRYAPGPSPFTTTFDWNRPGEPTQGGAGGQGFLRVHAIDGRLVVPDADPPYGGFGVVDGGTEGYVFVSSTEGVFAPPRMPRHRVPRAPDLVRDVPGAAVLPRAYHVLDAIAWRGLWIASTGSVPPRERAWSASSPGALHVANEARTRWTYALGWPAPAPRDNVWRLTYMVRFRGRLYAGIQDYFGRETRDYVVLDAPPDVRAVRPEDLRAVTVTDRGGAATIRWYADGGSLWWITLERDGRTHLRVTDDGDRWRELALPDGMGGVTDLVRWRDGLVLLSSQGLWRFDGSAFTRIADAPTETVWSHARRSAVSHLRLDDLFCAAPLAVYDNALYTGSQRDGSLWRLVEE